LEPGHVFAELEGLWRDAFAGIFEEGAADAEVAI
jgi:hypothetical protein